MSNEQFVSINNPGPSEGLISQLSVSASVTLSIPPSTDIYATPSPNLSHTYTAPILHRLISKRSFESARVTVSAPWKFIYDQGGLIFTIPSPSNPKPDGSNTTSQPDHPQWVKCGIEMNDGRPCISVVGKQRLGWADWSLWPIDGELGEAWAPGSVAEVTLEILQYKNALKVLRILKGEDGNEEKILVRKVPWVFLEGTEDEKAFVGIYGARPDPNKEAGGYLEVTFKDFQISE